MWKLIYFLFLIFVFSCEIRAGEWGIDIPRARELAGVVEGLTGSGGLFLEALATRIGPIMLTPSLFPEGEFSLFLGGGERGSLFRLSLAEGTFGPRVEGRLAELGTPFQDKEFPGWPFFFDRRVSPFRAYWHYSPHSLWVTTEPREIPLAPEPSDSHTRFSFVSPPLGDGATSDILAGWRGNFSIAPRISPVPTVEISGWLSPVTPGPGFKITATETVVLIPKKGGGGLSHIVSATGLGDWMESPLFSTLSPGMSLVFGDQGSATLMLFVHRLNRSFSPGVAIANAGKALTELGLAVVPFRGVPGGMRVDVPLFFPPTWFFAERGGFFFFANDPKWMEPRHLDLAEKKTTRDLAGFIAPGRFLRSLFPEMSANRLSQRWCDARRAFLEFGGRASGMKCPSGSNYLASGTHISCPHHGGASHFESALGEGEEAPSLVVEFQVAVQSATLILEGVVKGED